MESKPKGSFYPNRSSAVDKAGNRRKHYAENAQSKKDNKRTAKEVVIIGPYEKPGVPKEKVAHVREDAGVNKGRLSLRVIQRREGATRDVDLAHWVGVSFGFAMDFHRRLDVHTSRCCILRAGMCVQDMSQSSG